MTKTTTQFDCFKKISKFVLSLLIMLMLHANIRAQNEPDPIQNWTFIGASETNYQVSSRIIKCLPGTAAQLHLEIFNESSTDQLANFNITITNPINGLEEVHEISYSVIQAAIVKPDCYSNNHQSLKFDLPEGWNPETVQLLLTILQ